MITWYDLFFFLHLEGRDLLKDFRFFHFPDPRAKPRRKGAHYLFLTMCLLALSCTRVLPASRDDSVEPPWIHARCAS